MGSHMPSIQMGPMSSGHMHSGTSGQDYRRMSEPDMMNSMGTAPSRMLPKRRETYSIPTPMEFANFPPSSGGYYDSSMRRPAMMGGQQHMGTIGVAPYTSIIETDGQLRLTHVMGVDDNSAHQRRMTQQVPHLPIYGYADPQPVNVGIYERVGSAHERRMSQEPEVRDVPLYKWRRVSREDL